MITPHVNTPEPVPGWPPGGISCTLTLTPVKQEEDAARSYSEKSRIYQSKLPLFY